MSDPQEQWVVVQNFDGSETAYLVDNVFQISWAGVLNDYAVLIKEEDLTGTEEIIPDIFKFNTESEELHEIIDDEEKAYVVDFLISQYSQKPDILDEI